MGRELMPVITGLGQWGMRWARDGMHDGDLDLELLMLYLERSVQVDKLPGRETVIRFKFTDLDRYQDWWIVVADRKVDLCVREPGKEVDVYFTTDLRTMIEVWMGDTEYRSAIHGGRMKLVGPSALTRDVKHWLKPSIFAGIPPAHGIQ
jgi:hypothetical protein